jgi:tRNA (cmo5U34)-methyltransferase
MPSEWTKAEHVHNYLGRADTIPHRTEGEDALLDELPTTTRWVLDLGTGDGRLLALVLGHCPAAEGVAVDFSDTMLDKFAERFVGKDSPRIVRHDLSERLPDLGRFDAIVSSFVIHHLSHPRKRELYAEVFAALLPGGVFCNLEHVSSASALRHEQFLAAIDMPIEKEDPSNQLLDVHTQLGWLREIGFEDVDCLWKWRELALMCGIRPRGEAGR